MDPDFPEYYQKELNYITEALCGDFGKRHVKVAARFGMQAGEIKDPHIEQLAQSFAFIAAGAQMRIDRFSHPIPLRQLEGVDVNYAAPLPSLGVARFWPDAKGAHGAQGLVLPRGTRLTMGKAAEGHAECVFLTTQPVTMWPLEITRVKPTSIPADIPQLYRYLHDSEDASCVRGALRLRFATGNGTSLSKLEGLDRLPVYLCGEEGMASQLLELIHTSVIGVVMSAPGKFEEGDLYGMNCPGFPQMHVEYEGLEPENSLLRPVWPKWHGHRLVHDFFALPGRFGFFTLTSLAAGLKRIEGPEVEIVLLLSRTVGMLDQQIALSSFDKLTRWTTQS